MSPALRLELLGAWLKRVTCVVGIFQMLLSQPKEFEEDEAGEKAKKYK